MRSQIALTKTLRGWRHDGLGNCSTQTRYDDDAQAFARAEAADPGHVHPIYHWSYDGCANLFSTEEEALRHANRRHANGQEKKR